MNIRRWPTRAFSVIYVYTCKAVVARVNRNIGTLQMHPHTGEKVDARPIFERYGFNIVSLRAR